MKQIKLAYTNQINVDMLESIIRQKYPDKTFTRQNWGFNAPFLIIKMNFWLQETIFISQKPQKNITKVVVNEGCTLAGWFFLGWPTCWLFMKLHRKEVMNVIREELQASTNVVFLN